MTHNLRCRNFFIYFRDTSEFRIVFSTQTVISPRVWRCNPYRKAPPRRVGYSKALPVRAPLADTWHAVNGLILQRNGGMSRTEIWRLKVFPLKCSSFGSSRSWPPWCRSSETTSCRSRKEKEERHWSLQLLVHYCAYSDTNTHFPRQIEPQIWDWKLLNNRGLITKSQPFFLAYVMYVCLYVFICWGMDMHVWGWAKSLQESILSFQHVNSGHQAWWPVPLPAEPSCWSLLNLFILY